MEIKPTWGAGQRRRRGREREGNERWHWGQRDRRCQFLAWSESMQIIFDRQMGMHAAWCARCCGCCILCEVTKATKHPRTRLRPLSQPSFVRCSHCSRDILGILHFRFWTCHLYPLGISSPKSQTLSWGKWCVLGPSFFRGTCPRQRLRFYSGRWCQRFYRDLKLKTALGTSKLRASGAAIL